MLQTGDLILYQVSPFFT